MYSISQIIDGDKITQTVLIDQGIAGKLYFTITTEEIEQQLKDEPKPEIKYVEETKQIAGYTCKKAEMNIKDTENDKTTTIVVWYSEELGGEKLNYGTEFHGLKGFPLEYEKKIDDKSEITTATEIKKGKVKDIDLLVPADFKELTAEEKKQIMDAQKGNGGE